MHKWRRGRERGSKREFQADCTVSVEPHMWLELTKLRDQDLSPSRMLNRLSHPGTPKVKFLKHRTDSRRIENVGKLVPKS